MLYISVPLDTGTEPKIDQLHIDTLISPLTIDNILKLDIPMSNVLCMQILQSPSQLLHNLLALDFNKTMLTLFLQCMAQRDTWKVLHDDVQVVI